MFCLLKQPYANWPLFVCSFVNPSNTLLLQAIPGANALLIGLTYGMARSPLARVAAFTARCKFFDATASHITATNRATLREKIKKASQVAGLMGKPVVLVVRGEYGDQALQDVCSLMSEGNA